MSLEAHNVCFRYDKKGNWILKNIDFSIKAGEIVGLVGPSGYGKSTLGKILAGQLKPEIGQVLVDNKSIKLNEYSCVQLIYQHPELAVNPRWRMKQVLEEVGSVDTRLMENLGISDIFLNRYPLELSGGELQRFCVLRALSPKTRYIIADEISTMLDTITQAQIWNVILDFAQQNNIGILSITHNENLAKRICSRIVTF